MFTSDARPADLFNTSHYPVRAICRICSEPILAPHFLHEFEHVEEEHLAKIIPFRGPRDDARSSRR
jgi:hypothetical protein